MKLFLEITPRKGIITVFKKILSDVMKFTAIFVMNKYTYPPICKIACDVLIVFDEEIPLKCHYLIQYGYTLFN